MDVFITGDNTFIVSTLLNVYDLCSCGTHSNLSGDHLAVIYIGKWKDAGWGAENNVSQITSDVRF